MNLRNLKHIAILSFAAPAPGGLSGCAATTPERGFIIRVASALIFVSAAILTLALAPAANASERPAVTPSFSEWQESPSSASVKENGHWLAADVGAFRVMRGDDSRNFVIDENKGREKSRPTPMLIAQTDTSIDLSKFDEDIVQHSANPCDAFLRAQGLEPGESGFRVSGDSVPAIPGFVMTSVYTDEKRFKDGNKRYQVFEFKLTKGTRAAITRIIMYTFIKHKGGIPESVYILDDLHKKLLKVDFEASVEREEADIMDFDVAAESAVNCYVKKASLTQGIVALPTNLERFKSPRIFTKGFHSRKRTSYTAGGCDELYFNERVVRDTPSRENYRLLKACHNYGLLGRNRFALYKAKASE